MTTTLTSSFFKQLKKPSVLPGFGLTLGFTLVYLALVVLLPLSGLFFATAKLSWAEFFNTITAERVMHAYGVSFGTAFVAALINVVFGLIVAWILVRYDFPFKKIFDAMVDLPFALPTAVAGIALTSLYAPSGWIGQYLEPLGIKIAFTPLGITIALIFVGLPFVVRTVQPVLEDMNRELEEAAASLGATRTQIFLLIFLPHITPALMTGFAMAFARALGEYGSVIFIAGNKPMISEIIPLLIMTKLEQYDHAGATALAIVMLLVSFVMLYLINALQKWGQTRMLRDN
ncbi:MAG: sulfate ABC transporter permease subunit CysT [Alphaproteobacteria bacterium]|nr:sulfate ABC transporter permease subunit CysT [Alphaproteobacteria bacterium]